MPDLSRAIGDEKYEDSRRNEESKLDLILVVWERKTSGTNKFVNNVAIY